MKPTQFPKPHWTTVRDNHCAGYLVHSHNRNYRVVFDKDGGDIAYVVEADGDKGNTHARLIAAAPALLHACREALHRMEFDDERLGRDSTHQITAVRAAIALATGETAPTYV